MKSTFRYVLGIMLCGSLVQFAHAADAGAELPVTVGTGSLTVAGQGYWFRKDYQSGESPSISAYDNNGAVLPDGVYRYEFRSLPQGAGAGNSQDNLTTLEGERIGRRRVTAEAVNTVSGRFEIQGGEIIHR